MQNDSAPAAAQLHQLAVHWYLLDIGVPWRDSVPLQSNTVEFRCAHPEVRRKGRIQRSDTWSGEGSRSVSQSGGKEGNPLIATADFRRSSASP
jgi:hypothetical protein